MLSNKEQNDISRFISFLRFPATVGVVVNHGGVAKAFQSLNSDLNLPVAAFFDIFVHSCCGICVPLFFFISGYLFFLKGGDHWCADVYRSKLRSRFYSLFVPYVIYTYLAILIFAVLQAIAPELQSGRFTPIKDWAPLDFIMNGLWRNQHLNIPFVGALWYIRNLLCLVLLSPLIYWMIKHTRQWGIAIIGILCCSYIWTFGIPGTMGLFYFSWGGYFSLFHKDFTQTISRFMPAGLFALPLFVIDAVSKDAAWNPMLHQVAILLGVVLVISMTDRYLKRHDWKPNDMLLSSVFFVYAIHTPYIGSITKVIVKLIPLPHNAIIADLMVTAIYIPYCLIVVTCLVALFTFIKKRLPKVASVLSGGR